MIENLVVILVEIIVEILVEILVVILVEILVKILVTNRNFSQKSKFWSKIEILVTIFGQ